MKILPIAERELRVASRRAGTYWLRFFVVAVLMAISAWAYMITGRLQPQMVGKTVFYTLTGGVMFYVIFAGLRSTSDCLSEEKRDGTLGLLFLTDLRGYDVVVGKLLANSLAVFYCVLAVLPVLAVPLLMGGVAVAEFARLAGVIVNTLFFSLCAGMLASALSKSPRVAISWTLLLILLVIAGGPGLGLIEYWLRDWEGNYEYGFLATSPVFSYFSGVDEFYKRGFGTAYVVSLISVHGVAWLFLVLSSLIVRRSWQDKPATVKRLKWSGALRDVLEGDADVRHDFRTTLLNQNAFYWLATKPRQKAQWTWTPLAIAVVAWVWGILEAGGQWFNPGMYATTVIAIAVTLKAMIGAEAGRRLLEDRKVGALELILSTPLTVKEIVRGQRLAIQRQFNLPILTLLIIAFVLLLAGAAHHDMGGQDRRYWIWTGVAGSIVFLADIAALFWMGMWHGLSAKNPKHAFGLAIGPILVLPWGGVAIVMTVIEFLPREIRQSFRYGGMPLALWFVFSLTADVLFGVWARHKLLTQFRELAAERFQVKPSWWKRLLGMSDK